MLEMLRSVARFVSEKIGWHRIGFAISLVIIVTAGVVLYRMLRTIEIDELRHPIFVHQRRLMPDTEGAGRFRGALSAYSEFSPIDCSMTVAYVSDGNANPAGMIRSRPVSCQLFAPSFGNRSASCTSGTAPSTTSPFNGPFTARLSAGCAKA